MLFVAEIGMNHDGNWNLAYELIRQAKLAGADVAKFQFGWRDGPGEINRIDEDIARQLRAWCDELGIELLASIIKPEALDLAKAAGLKRVKIASRTVRDNPDLCKEILALGKETFISLGMWEKEGWPFGAPDGKRVRYIWCESKYPTYAKDLKKFPARFTPESHYGYSDHLHGIEGCLLAAGRGARYIEKHFTLNKTSQVIRDHVLSATPEEFRRLTEHGGRMSQLLNGIEGR